MVEWVRENRAAVRTAALIAFVLGVGGALVVLGATVSLFSTLGTVIGIVGSVPGGIATPVGLVVASFVGQIETGGG